MNPFPILYLNLGGELVYIIEQRLQAQNIVPDKASKGKTLVTLRMKYS